MRTEPFVLVGHSQGGMRALAFATYVKYRDPDMYRQIKGIITLSGIDRGLRLLNNNGADFRRTMQKDGGILARGVMALRISSIIQWRHFSDDDMNKSYSELTDWFGYSLAKVILESAAGTKGFAKPIMENANWNSYAQIRDMCPQSNFIKKYILTENDSTYKRQTGTTSSLRVKWRSGWFGIRYPVFYIERSPVYTVFHTAAVDMRLDRNMNIQFLLGERNDTFSLMDGTTASTVDNCINAGKTVFRIGQGIYIAKCCLLFGFFSNAPKYARDCREAAELCSDRQGTINAAIGSSANDGLVAEESQYLPSKSRAGADDEHIVLANTSMEKCPYNHFEIKDAEWEEAMNTKNKFLGKK